MEGNVYKVPTLATIFPPKVLVATVPVMYCLITLLLLPLPQVLSFPRSDLLSRALTSGVPVAGQISQGGNVSDGGLTSSLNQTLSLRNLPEVLKRAPTLEISPPPNTIFQNVPGYPWDDYQRFVSTCACPIVMLRRMSSDRVI